VLLASVASCLAFLSSGMAGATPEEKELVGKITLQERDALDLVVRSPYAGADARSSTLRFLEVADRALRDKSALFAREVKDSKEVVDAKGDAIQLLKATRRDVDVERLAREGKALEAHNAERRAAGDKLARFLVLVTLLPQGDKTRLSAILIDVDEGLDLLIREHGKTGADAAAELEARFQETAVIARPSPATVSGEDEALAYVEKLFSQDFRPMFEQRGAWATLGTIDVKTNVDGAEIRLDGALVGTSRPGVTRLEDARAGPRVVSLAASGYAPVEIPIQVRAKAITEVEANLDASGTGLAAARTMIFWGSLGVAAAGATMVVASIVGAGTQTNQFLCVHPNGQPTCDQSSWLRFGSGDTPQEQIAGSGLAIAPLGLGLMAGGGVTALGSELVEDDGIPWISIATGAVLSVATYLILNAAETPQVVTGPSD